MLLMAIWSCIKVDAGFEWSGLGLGWFKDDAQSLEGSKKEVITPGPIKLLVYIEKTLGKTENENLIISVERADNFKLFCQKILNIWIDVLLNKTVTIFVILCTCFIFFGVRFLIKGRPKVREQKNMETKRGAGGESGPKMSNSSIRGISGINYANFLSEFATSKCRKLPFGIKINLKLSILIKNS